MLEVAHRSELCSLLCGLLRRHDAGPCLSATFRSYRRAEQANTWTSDRAEVFNKVGRSLSIMDIILSLDKDSRLSCHTFEIFSLHEAKTPGDSRAQTSLQEERPLGDEAATSKEINAMVQA